MRMGRDGRARPGPRLMALAILGALTACTSGAAGGPSSSASSTRSPSSTPLTSGTAIPTPQLPASARGHDAASAQAFVRYWFDIVNYTFESRDTRLFRSLSTASCQFCADFASRVDQARIEGKTYRGGRFSPTVVVAPRPDSDGKVVVDSRASVQPGQVLSRDGVVLESSPGGSDYAVTVRLQPQTRGWIVSGVVKD
jgi:Family of unknown function (DUF6318)